MVISLMKEVKSMKGKSCHWKNCKMENCVKEKHEWKTRNGKTGSGKTVSSVYSTACRNPHYENPTITYQDGTDRIDMDGPINTKTIKAFFQNCR